MASKEPISDVQSDARGLGDVLDEGQRRRGRRLILLETGFVRVFMQSVTGLVLTALVLELGGGDSQVGYAQGAFWLGMAFQVLTNPILTRMQSRRRYCLIMLGVVRVIRVGIAALPLLVLVDVESQRLLGPLCGLLLLSGFFGPSAEIARQSWIADLVPHAQRGRFFGWRHLIGGSMGVVSLLAYGAFIDAWKVAGHDGLVGVQLVIAVGCGAGVASWICVYMTPEPRMALAATPTSLGASIRMPFADGPFRRFMTLHGATQFSTGVCGPFFDYFMLTFLGMSVAQVAVVDGVGNVAAAVCARYWGGLADRWGTKRMLRVALVAKAIFPLLWLGIRPDWWYVVFVVVLVRAFNTATQIGWQNMALGLSPREDRAAYLSIDRSLAGLCHAVAPLGAGVLVGMIGDSFVVGGVTFVAVHVLIALSGVLRLASLSLLRWVDEPAGR